MTIMREIDEFERIRGAPKLSTSISLFTANNSGNNSLSNFSSDVANDIWMLPVLPEQLETEPDSEIYFTE